MESDPDSELYQSSPLEMFSVIPDQEFVFLRPPSPVTPLSQSAWDCFLSDSDCFRYDSSTYEALQTILQHKIMTKVRRLDVLSSLQNRATLASEDFRNLLELRKI